MMVTASAFTASLQLCLHQSSEEPAMKLAGMLLLLAGWVIVVSALVLFARSGMRGLFVPGRFPRWNCSG